MLNQERAEVGGQGQEGGQGREGQPVGQWCWQVLHRVFFSALA